MTNPRKPLKIVIGGVNITTVFDGKGGRVRVRGQISCRPRHID